MKQLGTSYIWAFKTIMIIIMTFVLKYKQNFTNYFLTYTLQIYTSFLSYTKIFITQIFNIHTKI